MMKQEQGDYEMSAPGYKMTPDQKLAEELPAQSEVKPGMERLNFNVSPAFAMETRQLANSLNISMTQLFKFAMSIFKIAVDEARSGRKLVIADKNGKAIREFVLPGLE